MAEQIHSYSEIIAHLEAYKRIRHAIITENRLLRIAVKPPNLSEEITESLLCKMINGGVFLKEKYGLNAVAIRNGKKGADVIVNGLFKLECKGTSSKDGVVTVSKTNMLEREQWVWFDFSSYINHDSSIITVHVINNPDECIKPKKIQANGENKITLRNAVKQAQKTGNYEFHEFSLNTMAMKINNSEFISC